MPGDRGAGDAGGETNADVDDEDGRQGDQDDREGDRETAHESNQETERNRLVDHLLDEGYVYSSAVERAVLTVPRHCFVPEDLSDRAYEDEPLPIGEGQVVTAPHLVASMTELLEVCEGDRVLEVGTGSGYHAAVVAEIVGAENLVSIERFESLAEGARTNLERAGYGDVSVVVGDGSAGLPDRAPFDRIYVTCAGPDVPAPLVEQLADGGRMVVPVGTRRSQSLVLVQKRDGRVERTPYQAVRFVPMVGEFGYREDEAW